MRGAGEDSFEGGEAYMPMQMKQSLACKAGSVGTSMRSRNVAGLGNILQM
jgi:hypothetical protein